MNTDVLSVKQINCYIKSILDGDDNLKNIFITGEIYNFKSQFSSGHLYFTLRDETSSIHCVMFSKYAENLKFLPKDGEKVLARCSVSLFEKTGKYQLYVRDMQNLGKGDLDLNFILLKEKLETEGLFSQENKKEIPKYPKAIGVITSSNGAAVEDIKNVLKRRYNLAYIYIYPAYVQGEASAGNLIEGLKYFNDKNLVDTIIIGRGGGAQEDLCAFNDENLVRAIYNSEIPVISAVGHEINLTLSDLSADLRAPTPSAAAELATPDISDILMNLVEYKSNLYNLINYKILDNLQKLSCKQNTINLFSPKNKILTKQLQLKEIKTKMNTVLFHKFEKAKNRLEIIKIQLHLINPINVLNQGYAILLDNKDKIIKNTKTINKSDIIKIKAKDATLKCKVITKEE